MKAVYVITTPEKLKDNNAYTYACVDALYRRIVFSTPQLAEKWLRERCVRIEAFEKIDESERIITIRIAGTYFNILKCELYED